MCWACAWVHRVHRSQLTWQWYCIQANPTARILKLIIVGWVPALLLSLWQGMVLPLAFTALVQVRAGRGWAGVGRGGCQGAGGVGIGRAHV